MNYYHADPYEVLVLFQSLLERLSSEENYDSIRNSMDRADIFIKAWKTFAILFISNKQGYQTTTISNSNTNLEPEQRLHAIKTHRSTSSLVAYLSHQPKLKDLGRCASSIATDMHATASPEAILVGKLAITASSLKATSRMGLPRLQLSPDTLMRDARLKLLRVT